MTLKDFFKTYTKIVIPHIQRHYAQGRRDKHSTMVREKLVQSIFDQLEKNENLDLNFIYGSSPRGVTNSAENGEFELLDGQQRITTLFLFYWYLAVREKESIHEKESIFAYLSKFEYRTRTTATEFCHKITAKDFDIRKELETRSPSELLKDQSWFTYAYKCDSTIEGMLVMLDEIHGQYNKREKQDNLFDQLEHVIFSMEDIGDYPDKEDLYTKMNARGLLLTPFENFKADLLEHIKGDKGEAEEYGKWLDGDFLDFFWKIAQTSEKSKNVPPPDPLMMEFVNRFADVHMIIQTQNDEGSSSNKDEETTSFSNDYVSFTPYELIGDRGNGWQQLKDIFQFIYEDQSGKDISKDQQGNDLVKKVEEAWKPAWEPTAYVIPSPTKTAREGKDLCIFAAIYLYVEKFRENALPFEQWMRVCWNIVENIYDSTRKKGSIQLLNRLAGQLNDEQEGSDIYDKLTHINLDQVVTGSKPDIQRRVLREEIEKARAIKNGMIEMAPLKEAEKRFKGAIFFLFASGYNKNDGFTIKPEHWEKFDGKWETICGYVKETGESTPEKWAKFLRNMFSLLDTNDFLLGGCPIFDCSSDGLLLKKDEYLNLVYRTLSAENFDKEKDEKEFRDILKQTEVSPNTILKNMPYEIIKDIIEKVVSEEAEKRNYALYGESNVWIVYRKHKGNQSYYNDRLVLSKESIDRYAILKDCLEMGEVNMGKLTRWGYNSYFEYKEVNYTWTILPFNDDGGNKLNRIYKNNDREKRNDVPVRCQDKDEDVGEIQVDSDIKELIQNAIDRYYQKDLRSHLNN